MSNLPLHKQLVVDIFICGLVCLPLVLVQALAQPSLNGFWCHDSSLSYPLLPDTVSVPMLMLVSFGGPFFVMAVTESIRVICTVRLFRQFRAGMLSFSKAYGVFFFGMVVTCLFTEIFKFSVGRLRPNFLDTCRPDYDKINCTSDQGGPRFIVTYTCTNTMVDEKVIKDSHLSFPSGHASMSVFSALFTIFYLQMRMEVTFSYLLRPALQLCLLLFALMCCVTRVTDHKHFPSDVLGGAALGGCLALFTFYRIGHSVIPSQPSDKPPRLARATSIESEPQTPIPLLRPERLVLSNSYRNHSGPDSKHDFVHNV